jgi:hypothetical protein
MIISLAGGSVPAGRFHGQSTIVAPTREECLKFVKEHQFADDLGFSTREDDGVVVYTMIGGEIIPEESGDAE